MNEVAAGNPFGEAREVLDKRGVIGSEIMRPIALGTNAGGVGKVMRIPGQVRPPVHQKNFPPLFRSLAGRRAAHRSGPGDD